MSKKVALMCGHGKSTDGSWDPGTTWNGYTEAALMLPITKAAVEYLRNRGVTVISDADTSNDKNMIVDVKWANKEKADIYVSVHCDYSKAPTGVMPLYVSTSGKKLATALNSAISDGMPMKSRGVCKRTDLWELNGTDMTASILETGAIKADIDILKNQPVKYGELIAKGICDYLGISFDAPQTQAPTQQTAQTPAASAYTGEYPSITVTVSGSKGAEIARLAQAYAYETNSSKATYKSGKPKAAYKTALYKAYPTLKGGSSPASKGASCDVFVGTVVRMAGIDSKYPRGFSPDYTGKCGYFTAVKAANIKSGDIIFTDHHVCIYVDGKIKEASNGDFYPKTTSTAKARIKAAKHIYRAKGSTTTRNYMQKGDSGSEVTKLQKYLKWYGFTGIGVDGIFGSETESCVKQFQLDQGIESDGKAGAETLAAMKRVVK